MLRNLSVDAINEKSPYPVCLNEKTGFYEFLTSFGTKFAVGFMDDDLLTCGESYQFLITNTNKKPSPKDKNVQLTIQLLIEDFFRQNVATMLYICETEDGKQAMRSRLFQYWFFSYANKANYTFLQTTLEDTENTTNYAAVIVRNDNPKLSEIISEFSHTIHLFNNKPE